MSELTWRQMHEAAVEFQADLQDKLSASQAREAELREKLEFSEAICAADGALITGLRSDVAEYKQRAEAAEAELRKLLEAKESDIDQATRLNG